MAEEKIPNIDDVMESHSEFNKARKRYVSAEKTLQESERVSQDELTKNKEKIEQLREKRNKLRSSYEETSKKYTEHRNVWQKDLATKLGLKPTDIDFNKFDFSASDAKPKICEYLEKLYDDDIDGFLKLQKYYGEEGKTLKNSPITFQKIKEFLFKKDPNLGMMVCIILGDIIPGLIAWRGTGFWKKHSPKDCANDSIGCYQYNITSGEIRYLGTCGANATGVCCATKDPKIAFCTKDDDCLSNKSCKKNEDCDNGPCIKNGSNPAVECSTKDTDCFCRGQTCDKDGDNPTFLCTPCPSPEYSIDDQIGSLSICTGGYPLSSCPVGGLICQARATDSDGFVHGSCKSCDGATDEEQDTCANSGDEWITTSVCNDGVSLVIALESMRQYQDTWLPQSVPVLSWVVVAVGVIGFILTFIWYIEYLIKNSKK